MRSVDDIDFAQISPQRFEELCHDLLEAGGYRKLIWRQGGSDGGRDIEAYLVCSNGVTEDFEERWFFECKRYIAGVSPSELNSKIAWADAERPRHLVFFVSSYLTKDTIIWLKAITQTKPYMIHVMDGKRIKSLLVRNSHIFNRYFPSSRKRIAEEVVKNWSARDESPNPQKLLQLVQGANAEEYSLQENALIFIFSRSHRQLIDQWLNDNDLKDYGFAYLVASRNTVQNIKDKFSLKSTSSCIHSRSINDVEYVSARIAFLEGEIMKEADYFIYRQGDKGLEVLLSKHGDTLIREITHQAKAEVEAAQTHLANLPFAHPPYPPACVMAPIT